MSWSSTVIEGVFLRWAGPECVAFRGPEHSYLRKVGLRLLLG